MVSLFLYFKFVTLLTVLRKTLTLPFVLVHILPPPLSYSTKSNPTETDISSPTVNSNKYYTLTNLLDTFNIKQNLKQPQM